MMFMASDAEAQSPLLLIFKLTPNNIHSLALVHDPHPYPNPGAFFFDISRFF